MSQNESSGCLLGEASGMGCAPQDVLMTELIMVDNTGRMSSSAPATLADAFS
jgi:hypothetical protein